MLVAICLVTGLAWWDERREAEAALSDLESEQSVLASSVADTLRGHLTSLVREAVLVGEHGPGALGDRYAPVVVRSASEPRTTPLDPTQLILAVPIADGRVVDVGARVGDLLDPTRHLGHPGELLLLLAAPNQTAAFSIPTNLKNPITSPT